MRARWEASVKPVDSVKAFAASSGGSAARAVGYPYEWGSTADSSASETPSAAEGNSPPVSAPTFDEGSVSVENRERTSSRGTSERAPREETKRDFSGAGQVMVVDDYRLFRDCLVAILSGSGIPVIGTAWDLPSLVRALAEVKANLILIDMATRDSYLLLRAAMSVNPDVRVIALGASERDQSELIACAEAGVAAYHKRSDSLSDLLMLLRTVPDEGSTPMSHMAALLLRRQTTRSAPASERRDIALTMRETQILRMLELGRSNRDIAARLDIAVHTVKNHVHNLLTKLGVNTRAEAAAVSRTLRL
jgi:DNA-binding NarL/FixJ family response regulator